MKKERQKNRKIFFCRSETTLISHSFSFGEAQTLSIKSITLLFFCIVEIFVRFV